MEETAAAARRTLLAQNEKAHKINQQGNKQLEKEIFIDEDPDDDCDDEHSEVQ